MSGLNKQFAMWCSVNDIRDSVTFYRLQHSKRITKNKYNNHVDTLVANQFTNNNLSCLILKINVEKS